MAPVAEANDQLKKKKINIIQYWFTKSVLNSTVY